MSPFSSVVDQADSLLWRQRPREALSILEPAIRRKPEDAELWRLRAIALANSGWFRKAVKAAEVSRRLAPNDLEVAATHSRLVRESGELMRAARMLRILLRKHPEHASSWAEFGYVELFRGQLVEARKSFERALRLDSRCVHARIGLAESSQDALERIRAWYRALRLAPDYAAGWAELGVFLALADRDREALRANRRAARLEGRDRYLPDVARQLYFMDRVSEALRVCRRALQMNPRNGQAWGEIAFLYAIRDRVRLADRAYDHAVRFAPGDGYIRELRGHHRQDRARTMADLLRALDDFRAAEKLGETTLAKQISVLIDLGEFRKAALLCTQLVRQGESDGYRFRGWCAYFAGDFAAAMRDFRNALRLKNFFADSTLGLAKCAAALGRHTQAREVLARFLQFPERSSHELHEVARVFRYIGDDEEAGHADSLARKANPQFMRQKVHWAGPMRFLHAKTWREYWRWLHSRGLPI